MEKWFVLPMSQYSRKGLEIAIEEFGGSMDPIEGEVRTLDHRTEKFLLFEIDHRGVVWLDQSIRDGERWQFRFFRQRNELEMIVEQVLKKNDLRKILAMKRAIRKRQNCGR